MKKEVLNQLDHVVIAHPNLDLATVFMRGMFFGL